MPAPLQQLSYLAKGKKVFMFPQFAAICSVICTTTVAE
jgi:hypothetical protein